eukprot:scaffold10348_cov63-Phaeocystis_antarctica.AAC.4
MLQQQRALQPLVERVGISSGRYDRWSRGEGLVLGSVRVRVRIRVGISRGRYDRWSRGEGLVLGGRYDRWSRGEGLVLGSVRVRVRIRVGISRRRYNRWSRGEGLVLGRYRSSMRFNEVVVDAAEWVRNLPHTCRTLTECVSSAHRVRAACIPARRGILACCTPTRALPLLLTRCATYPTRSKHYYTMALLGLCHYY